MTTRLVALGAEFLALRDMAAQLASVPEGEASNRQAHQDAVISLICGQMFELAQTIVSTHARSPEELAYKARVALDWIDDDGDMTDLLAGSVCRDVIVLFPTKP